MTRHTISITPGTIAIAILMGVGAYVLFLLKDLALLVLTAVVLSSAVEPGVTFFMRYKIPRIFSVIILYLLLITFLIAAAYLFVPPFLDEMSVLLTLLPQYLSTFSLPASLESAPIIGNSLEEGTASLIKYLSFFEGSFFVDTGQGVLKTLSALFGGVFSFLLTVLLSFYFSIQDTGVDDFLRIVTPVRHQTYVLSLWRRSQRKIGLWMQGQLILSVIIAILLYLGLTILGVPYAFLLAIFAGLAELVPVFGSIAAALPGVAVAFGVGGLPLTLIVAGLYLVVNQFQAHLIYPLVVKKIVGVPPLLVILALIAGGQLAGFLGVILSVPVAAAVQELVADLQKHRRQQASA
jgi:predicted PurR-regulated permease PerM